MSEILQEKSRGPQKRGSALPPIFITADGFKVRECKMSQDREVVSPAAASEVDGAATLLRLASLGKELGAQYIADDGHALAARVSEGRFYLACIGQFKRGKSTLINALIGEPILPVGLFL